MQIIKVELKNIKNHADATFEFGPGVVAICGPNGAGKTTILEAIAWTLFDHLSYTRENFLKRGEKRGSVRVTFISQDDGREYEVFRDTAGAYNVYDPRLKMKIVEQKAQVSKWLRQHLGVEPGTDLATLFRTTIGVPQGTFTVDFAESVAKRKPTFDKILKVEEYQRSAELMKDVSRLIEKKLAEVREQIAGAEGELKRYDEVASEMNKMQSQLTDIESQLSGAIGERDRNQIEFAEFDSLKSQLDQLRNDVERLSFKFEQEEKQRLNIAAEFARAQTAADSVQRTAAGYEQYLAARDRLSALSADRSQRDKLRSELTKIETAIIRTQSELQNLSRQLSEIEVAKRETYELTPKIVQQESLESKRSELQRMAGQRQTLEDSLKEFDKELVLLRSRYAETSRQIEETEKLEASAEQVKQLEEDVAAKEAVLSAKELAWKTLVDRRAEFERIKAAVARNVDEIATIESQLSAIASTAEFGGKVDELELAFQKLIDETAMLSAEIAKDQKMLAEVKNGLCPLLSERCLNMKEGQTLDQFFGVQLADNKARLSSLRQTRTLIETDLKAAREAAAALIQQSSLYGQLEKRREEMRLQQSHVAEIEKYLQEAGDVSESLIGELRRDLQSVKAALSKARSEQSKYESLLPLRQRLEEIKQEGSRRRQVYDKQKEQLADLTVSLGKLKEIEDELVSLGDPRGRTRQLNVVIAKEAKLQEAQSAAAATESSLNSEKTNTSEKLATFENLDLQWQETIATQAANEKDYQDYLANLATSKTVDSRRSELAQIEDEVAVTEKHLLEAKERLAALEPKYNKERHDSMRIALELVRGKIARLEAEIDGASRRVAAVKAELDQLDLVKARVSEHIARRLKLEEVSELSVFIRDCLKKAGPHITEAYLYTISIKANQLFRDISGNALVNLKWDKEYEILLEEAGRERPFANLSGGEQMAAALAVRLALLKELSDLRIAFFDEPTTNMDEERRRNLAQQIGHITDFDQLFIISHDDSFEGYTDEVINIGKRTAETVQ